EVVRELERSGLRGAAGADVVGQRDVLGILAEADAGGMRADRHAELRSHEQDGEYLVRATEAAIVELAEVDRFRLQELLEHDSVVRVLAGRDADGTDGATDRGVAENVVGAGWRVDPERFELGDRAH